MGKGKTTLTHETILVLITGLIAGGLGLLGAKIGADGAIEAATLAQDRATAAEVGAEMRTRKAEVYQRYLDTTSIYYNESVRTAGLVADLDESPQAGDPILSIWESTRSDYQGAVNDVYAFGSNVAVDRLRRVAVSLPGAVGKPTADDIADLQALGAIERFRAAYRVFQDGLCEEVNLDPTRDCSN